MADPEVLEKEQLGCAYAKQAGYTDVERERIAQSDRITRAEEEIRRRIERADAATRARTGELMPDTRIIHSELDEEKYKDQIRDLIVSRESGPNGWKPTHTPKSETWERIYGRPSRA